MVKGYCLKDKKTVDIVDPQFELNKKGRPVVHGKCSVCHGKVYKMLSAAEVPADLKAKMPAKKGSGDEDLFEGGGQRKHSKRHSKKSKHSKSSKHSKHSKSSKHSKHSKSSKRSKHSKHSKRSKK